MILSRITDEWKKKSRTIDVNNLLALTEIIDDYSAFCEDLEELIRTPRNKNLIREAYKTMTSKSTYLYFKYQSFIEKHKRTIDILNEYHCLGDFTLSKYDLRGVRRLDTSEDYFYKYLKSHRDDVESIRSLLERLKSLGIEHIYFGDKLSFDGIQYEIYPGYGGDFAFLENMHAVPAYVNSPIKYETDDSAYAIILDTSGFGKIMHISNYGRSIFLNTLNIEPNRLPESIEVETTLGTIQQLFESNRSVQRDIVDSVDFDIASSDLQTNFDRFLAIVNRIDRVKDNTELKELLTKMQESLDKIKTVGEELEDGVVQDHDVLTKEKMDTERKLYLQRRELAALDLD